MYFCNDFAKKSQKSSRDMAKRRPLFNAYILSCNTRPKKHSTGVKKNPQAKPQNVFIMKKLKLNQHVRHIKQTSEKNVHTLIADKNSQRT